MRQRLQAPPGLPLTVCMVACEVLLCVPLCNPTIRRAVLQRCMYSALRCKRCTVPYRSHSANASSAPQPRLPWSCSKQRKCMYIAVQAQRITSS